MRRPSRNTGAVSFRAVALITAFAYVVFLFTSQAAARDESHPFVSAASSSTFPQPWGWPRVLSSAVTTEQIGPGVAYDRWTLSTDAGPLAVSLATIDTHNPNVALAIETHDHRIIGKGERLSSMADRLGAELGINADYFDISESGSPLNLVAIDQRVLHQPDRAAAFMIDNQNRIQMGPLSWRAHLQSAAGAQRDISLVNEWSASVDLALLTPELGTTVADGATELLLEPAGTPGQFRVTRLDANLHVLDTLAQEQLGVAARGAAAQSLANDFRPGDIVTVTEQSDTASTGIKLGIGGGPLLVQDGRMIADPNAPAPEETNVRNPVTGAGLSADGATLWLVVVDGRRPALSIGLTRPQFAALFIALGASTAMAFDSGGSSEMVIRSLGDQTTSVANAPSDGRERSIADGLFVRNTAPAGPIVKLILKAPSAQWLVGSKADIQVRAVDANGQPVPVRAPDVVFNVEPSSAATIDRNGVLQALQPGTARVTVTLAGVSAAAAIDVVSAVDTLRIVPADPAIAAGAHLQLSINALTRDGQPIVVDAGAVRWSGDGRGGRVSSDGTFVAPGFPARTLVTATVGATSASTTVLSGEHTVMLQAIPSLSAWRFEARPLDLPGGVDAEAAPDGAQALRLAYDFSNAAATRAAYAQTELPLPGQPLALALDVYGDGNKEWLRGGYRNADGNNESLTIARRVDWRGWKTIRVAIPAQAAWPIVWTRLYVIERAKDAREQGSLWCRNLKLYFAGP